MTVVINSFSQIARRLGIEKGGRANAKLTEICAKKMDKYVPKSANDSKSSLRTNIELTNKSVTYQSPYAAYQYYGQRSDGSHVISNWTTPGTGPKWDQRMLSAEKQQIIDQMNRYIKGYGAD